MTTYVVVGNQTLLGPELANRLEDLERNDPALHLVAVVPVATGTVLPTEIGGVMGGVAVLDVETQMVLESDARERLDAFRDWCAQRDIAVDGGTVVGDVLPAIEQLVASHDVAEVIVSTLPSRLSRWLRVDLVRRIARRVDVPVTTISAADDREEPTSAPEVQNGLERRAPAPEPTQAQRRKPVTESVYKIVELVGTSTESWEKAAAAAVATAARSLRDLRVAEIAELDMVIDDGQVTAYRAKIKVSFKYEARDDD